ncbi:MAG: V-type ATP synthase subunit F [Eubacteriaceae bacterium]|jgi:V/A-type H+-transporting ATPase subunit F
MSNKNKLSVVGERDSVMIFKALGFITVYAQTAEEVEKAVKDLAREETPVIYITESAAEKIPETIAHFKSEPYPAIIPIPDKTGSKGLGMKGINANVEKAVGTNIFE